MKYFAYGTNLSQARIKSRCPSAIKYATGILKNHKLIFNSRGVASIIASDESEVHGLIYDIPDSQITSLDNYEGVPKHYTKQRFLIETDNEEVDCLIYVATDYEPGKPRDEHFDIIMQAMDELGFPNHYKESISLYGSR
jgi:gamma-glutamylcyclotransferase (GGCT)/AIG2-like uncharacterized protein YtfP